MSITYGSDAKVSDRYLIDVFVIRDQSSEWPESAEATVQAKPNKEHNTVRIFNGLYLCSMLYDRLFWGPQGTSKMPHEDEFLWGSFTHCWTSVLQSQLVTRHRDTAQTPVRFVCCEVHLNNGAYHPCDYYWDNNFDTLYSNEVITTHPKFGYPSMKSKWVTMNCQRWRDSRILASAMDTERYALLLIIAPQNKLTG